MKKVVLIIISFMFSILQCEAEVIDKFYKTVYQDNSFITYEITETEFNNATIFQLLSSFAETEYKKVSLSSYGNIINMNVEWKKTPKYKSFDVIAIMFDGVTYDANSIMGYQTATLTNNNIKSVNYALSSSNTKILNNGFGISMNLIDSGMFFTLSISVRFTGNGKIYGNYRHATSNVSLNQSLKYELNKGVINFLDKTMDNLYDKINPLSLNL